MISLGWSDLKIQSMSNMYSLSSAEFWTFSLPNGIERSSDETYSYLAGTKFFKVKDIEVY